MALTAHDKQAQQEWFRLPVSETEQRFDTDQHRGLGAPEVARRQGYYGTNEIGEERKRSPLKMFLKQFTDFMILVLIAAAIISGVIGEAIDTYAILAIIILNGVIGFVANHNCFAGGVTNLAIGSENISIIKYKNR